MQLAPDRVNDYCGGAIPVFVVPPHKSEDMLITASQLQSVGPV